MDKVVVDGESLSLEAVEQYIACSRHRLFRGTCLSIITPVTPLAELEGMGEKDKVKIILASGAMEAMAVMGLLDAEVRSTWTRQMRRSQTISSERT